MTPKFRVWRKDEKEMYDQEEIDEGGMFPQINFYSKKKELLGRFENLSKAIVDGGKNLILLQSTGLKDKNGKEIFEGDIVKWDERIWRIIWDSRDACWKLLSEPDHETIWHFDGKVQKECEVIGNIYENPELLKESKQCAGP